MGQRVALFDEAALNTTRMLFLSAWEIFMNITHDCCGYFKLHLHKEVFNILPRIKLQNLCEILKKKLYRSFNFYLFYCFNLSPHVLPCSLLNYATLPNFAETKFYP